MVLDTPYKVLYIGLQLFLFQKSNLFLKFMRIICNKEEKFNKLYDTYAKLVASIAYSILHDSELVKETLQEGFIRIYKHLDYFSDITSRSTKALISIIFRNVAIDLYNKRKKIYEQELSDDEMERFAVNIDPVLENNYEGLLKYTKQLNTQNAYTLILKYYYRYNYQEIAAFLGITESAVKMRIKRSKKIIRELLDKGEIKDE